MTESKFLSKFTKKLKELYPGGFIYKIPDTKGLGGMRPFDLIAIIGGVTFCIEAKRDAKKKVTEYQMHNLTLANENGARCLVLYPENKEFVLKEIEGAQKWKSETYQKYSKSSSESRGISPAMKKK